MNALNLEKPKQIKYLLKCAILLATNNVSNQRSAKEWWKVVFFAHTHGYLYVGFNGEDIDLVAIAYRVPTVSIKTGDELPKEESGQILYVVAAASKSKDKHKFLRLLSYYLRENAHVNYLAYHYRNSDCLKIHKIRRHRIGKKVIKPINP